jgi:hypothetical protein
MKGIILSKKRYLNEDKLDKQSREVLTKLLKVITINKHKQPFQL